MPSSHRAGERRALTLLVAACVALLTGLLAMASVSSAATSCLGKGATIVRGGGNDVINGTKAPDVIVGGGGNDTINGLGGNDRICGGPGDDTIDSGKGSDRLSGDEGDDKMTGLTGKDELDGGPGNDEMRGWRGSDELNGGGGTDNLFGDTGNDSMTGGPGDGDYVDGGAGDEPLVSGGAGNFDIVVGNTGIDQVDGGPGEHDVASYATSSVALTINLTAGTMSGSESEQLKGIEDALGGSANDNLTGNAGANRLDGGPGDDQLQASGGGDAAYGGPGSDVCSGGFASENSCGRSGGSELAVAFELLESIDGASSFIIGGTGGNDSVSARQSGGTFVAEGTSGTLVVPGGTGSCSQSSSNTVTCTGTVKRVQAALGNGNDVLSLSGISRGVEGVLDGGRGSDEIGGGPGRDVLYSGDDKAPDTLIGGGGDDVLFGVNTAHPRRDSGAAKMIGGGGSDLMVGGQPCDGDLFDGGASGNDSASFARIRNSGIFVHAQIGGPVSDPDAGGCNAGSIDGSTEKIEGSPGPDQLLGDGSGNTLLGRGGNDSLDGKGGHDRCIGGGGHDSAANCESKFSL